jgi:hypothetical protein
MVPVDETEEAEELSQTSSGFIDSGMGASDGNLASLDLAKDFGRSLILSGYSDVSIKMRGITSGFR